jgi:predicted acylesterase/phospholipase RssA
MTAAADLGALLSASPLFAGFDAENLRWLASAMERRELPGGTLLFRQGEPGDALYLVVHGRLRVTVAGDRGDERAVAEVGRGETVGEMALLSGEPRSATVRALRDTLLLRLGREDFERVCEAHPRVMTRLARQLVLRLQKGLEGALPPQRPRTVALVAADPGADLPTFASRLGEALSRTARVLHVNQGLIESLSGHGGALDTESSLETPLAGWLNDQESLVELVLYESAGPGSPWTRRCLRQADRVLLVARAGADPAGMDAALSAQGPESHARRELVLLHPDGGGNPSGTARWLDARPELEGRVHHLRAGDSRDLDRLARYLTGRAIGLVLGGGGARGFAHIGVVRAFEESGVPIDCVGGPSAGAFIGAQVALGRDAGTIKEAVREAFLESPSLLDYTLPVVSLIAGRRFQRMLARMYGDACIEDLWRRYFCISSNLTHGTATTHRRGPLTRWVAASIAVPGIGPPVCDQGELLVDGSMLLNLPVDEMALACEGPVVAVSASPASDLRVPSSLSDMPSAWTIVASRLNPFAKRVEVPGIFSLLAHTALLGSLPGHRNVRERVALYMEPDVSSVSLLDFSALDRAEELGYRHAMEKIEGWLASR